jgi:hypothetical protein
MDLLSLIVLRFKITCKEESHEKVFRSSCSNRQLRSPRFRGGIYVAFDPASHKCTMMHSQPTAPMKSMGSFKSEAEAKAAMGKMKECEG